MNDEKQTSNTTSDAMKEKLVQAGKKAETDKTERRERAVKGSHLLAPLLEKATKVDGLKSEEKTGFVKITGSVKGRAVYVARKGGRVDLSGFTVEAEAINQLTEQQAKEKHLGKVRGQLNFDLEDDKVLAAYDHALAKLLTE